MKLYTSYFGNLKKLEKAGIVPIAVSLTIPAWAIVNREKCWLKALAPHGAMLKLPPHLYIPKYEKILSGHKPITICKVIRNMSQDKDAALLCWEKDPDQCHRTIIAKWLNTNLGTHVEEYGVKKVLAEQETFFDDSDGGFMNRAVNHIES